MVDGGLGGLQVTMFKQVRVDRQNDRDTHD